MYTYTYTYTYTYIYIYTNNYTYTYICVKHQRQVKRLSQPPGIAKYARGHCEALNMDNSATQISYARASWTSIKKNMLRRIEKIVSLQA